MKIKTFSVNPFQVNTYLYFDEVSKEGIIIDPGFYWEYEIKNFEDFISKEEIILKGIYLTHGHIDHILGINFIRNNYNVKSYLQFEDKFLVENAISQGVMFGLESFEEIKIDNYFEDPISISLGETIIECIFTPGHSPGGVCYIDKINKNVFCGDLIFMNSIGRTDLPKGDYSLLIDSIENSLFKSCNDDYILYPGHMEPTSIGNEKKNNQFLKH
jgi:hydroxyacylglutathione hydrolase